MLNRLTENNSPQEYTLSGLNLGNVRLRLLATHLEKNTSLLGIHLSRKELNDIDTVTLAQVLKNNKKLEKMELEGNQLGPGSAKLLASVLKEDNKVLRVLDLESNPLTGPSKQDDSGIHAIAEMLSVNKKLLCLNLDNTGLDEKCGDTLVQVMEYNNTLISLEIAHNELSVAQIEQIQKYLVRNKKAYDEERLREFKERKLMNDEDSATKHLSDIEENKKKTVELEEQNKMHRQDERHKKYSELVLVDKIIFLDGRIRTQEATHHKDAGRSGSTRRQGQRQRQG